MKEITTTPFDLTEAFERSNEIQKNLAKQEQMITAMFKSLTAGTDYYSFTNKIGSAGVSLSQAGALKIQRLTGLEVRLTQEFLGYEDSPCENAVDKRFRARFIARCYSNDKPVGQEYIGQSYSTDSNINTRNMGEAESQCELIARKRAFVGTIRLTCGLAGKTTQDIEEMNPSWVQRADIRDKDAVSRITKQEQTKVYDIYKLARKLKSVNTNDLRRIINEFGGAKNKNWTRVEDIEKEHYEEFITLLKVGEENGK